jgi:hypothetical protein
MLERALHPVVTGYGGDGGQFLTDHSHQEKQPQAYRKSFVEPCVTVKRNFTQFIA